MQMESEGVTPAYMELAQIKFALKLREYMNDHALKEKLMNGIKQGNMAPYYKEVSTNKINIKFIIIRFICLFNLYAFLLTGMYGFGLGDG
jgi:hypothetical protein